MKHLFAIYIASALLCSMLVACFNDGESDPYRTPETATITDLGEGGGPPDYYPLCESSGGAIESILCCNNVKALVDTCDPDYKPCPNGGAVCRNVKVCTCGEGLCYDLALGCVSQP